MDPYPRPPESGWPAIPALTTDLRRRATVLALAAALAAAAAAWTQRPDLPSDARVVRAYFDDPLVAARAVISLEALESEYEKGYIVLLATDDDIEAARQAGMRVVEDRDYTVVALPSELPTAVVQGAVAGYPCYRTVEETYASAQAIVSRHPTLATWTAVGKSWRETQRPSRGYDLYVLRLTNSTTSGTKPDLFVTGAVHAREYTTAEFVLRFAERLADSYETDADVRWLLDHQEVHLMLQSNPDGRKQAESGKLWRKNENTDHCPSYRPGVDLNRNFDFKWGGTGASNWECSLNYRGSSAVSEPETKAISTYMTNLFPDARGPDDTDASPADTSGVFLDIHGHGRLVLWPWGHIEQAPPNGAALETFGRKLAFFNGHLPQQAVGLYPTSGTIDDYAYGVLGRAGFTYELGMSFFESCSTFENSILEGNLKSLLYAFKVARTPYQTPAGPDVRDLSLSDSASTAGVAAGTSVTLSATADDTRYSTRNGAESSQNIAAAEYYVDTPPWANGATAVAMSASDDAFDSTSEAVTASMDTTGWTNGRHTVFVRAKDADDNWGAVSAAFLFVGSAPPDAPAPTLTAGVAQLTVAWSAPAHHSSSITGYVLRHKPAGRGFGWSIVDVGNALSHTMTSLAPNRRVDIQVRAANAVGKSVWSPVETGAPRANMPPAPVGTPPAVSMGLDRGAVSISVSEMFEDPDDDPVTYGAGSSNSSVVTASANGSQVTLTPRSVGTTVITITATDETGSNTAGTQRFDGTVTPARGVSAVPETLTVTEGSTASYTLVLDAVPSGDVTIAVDVPAGAELSASPSSLTFTTTSWEQPQTVIVEAMEEDGDALADDPVELQHSVSGADYGSATAPAVQVTIVENDAPTFSVEDARASESDGAVVFEVQLSLASASQVTVDYATSDGAGADGAGSGSDYTATSGTLTFPAANTAPRTVSVPVMDDNVDEAETERFVFTLRNPSNAALAGGGSNLEVQGTIQDNDESTLSVADAEASESDGAVVFEVELSLASTSEVTVDYATSDGPGADGALSGSDYTAASGTLTFAPGSRGSQSVHVPVIDDVDEGGSKSFGFHLQNAFNAALAGGGSILEVLGTIRDNDGADPGDGDSGDGTGGGNPGGGATTPSPGDDTEGGDDAEGGEDAEGGDGAGTPPDAAFTHDIDCVGDPCRTRVGVQVVFSDSSAGAVRFRTWELGDGTRSRRPTVEHVWREPGFYHVTLRVSDGTSESTATGTFLVESAAPRGTCDATSHARCLRDSRYAVRLDWWTTDGEVSPAEVVHVGTDDSGLFRFFDRDNWEVLIKVLNGCSINENVWVFGASTTTLGYRIEITDTATGAAKEYRNEPGVMAPAITDAKAFPEGCRP